LAARIADFLGLGTITTPATQGFDAGFLPGIRVDRETRCATYH